VRDPGRVDRAALLEPQAWVDVREQTRPAAEQDRNDLQLDLFHELGRQVLVDRLRTASAPPPMITSLPRAAWLACSSADSIPSATKVNVVSDRVRGSRG
jgi:hypothetical protein